MSRMNRSTLILAGVTALAVALAAYVLGSQRSDRAPVFQPQRMFADLAAHMDSVARISIRTEAEHFDVVRQDDGIWVLPEKGDYPASRQAVRTTLLALARLELIEPKTARAERHAALGLVAPEDKGRAVAVALYGADGKALARLLVGDEAPFDMGREAAFYVRAPDGAQTWLARAPARIRSDLVDWIEQEVLALARPDIKSVQVIPANGPSYVLARADAEVSDMTLQEPPAGRTPKPGYILNTTAFAPVGMTITDVRPAADIDFSAAARAIYTTFDGVAYTLDLAAQEGGYWVRIAAAPVALEERSVQDAGEVVEEAADDDETATAAPAETAETAEATTAEEAAGPDPAETAARSNARTTGWAFAIAEYKYDQMVKPLDELLEAPEEEASSQP